MIAHRGIIHECPACGKECDAVAGVNSNAKPSKGDVTVCIGCGAISEFNAKMELTVVPAARCLKPDMRDARQVQRRVRIMRGLPV